MSLAGDLNHDGKLDQQDLAFLRQLVRENPKLLQHLSDQEKACLDVNHDGHIDYEDVVALCGKLIQKNESLSAQSQDKFASLSSKLHHS